MKRALCIGHLAYDITLPMDGYPEENNKYQIDTTLESSGGPASNAAALLALWGTQAAFMGTVGLDFYGERALRDLREAGVDIRGVSRKGSLATPLSIILVNTRTGSRTIINRRGGGIISKEEAEGLFSHLKSSPPDLLLLDGHEPEASLVALKKFPSAISILDAGSLRRGTELLASRVTYCIASERFAQDVLALQDGPNSLTPQREFSNRNALPPSSFNHTQIPFGRLLAALVSFGISYPVVTLGEEGCCFLEGIPSGKKDNPGPAPQSRNVPQGLTLPPVSRTTQATRPVQENWIPQGTMQSQGSLTFQGNSALQNTWNPQGFLLPAYPAKAIDTTGAGDIFHGAFAAAILFGMSFRDALRIATVAAGLSVERLGGKPSIPPVEEVMKKAETWMPTWHPIPIP